MQSPEVALAPEPTAVVAPAAGSPGRSRLLGNIVALSLSQLVTWSVTLAWTLIVPRVLGPAGIGLLVLSWSASSLLVAVCGLGSRTMLVREIAADPRRAPVLMGTAMIVRTATILPCVVAVALYVRLAHFDQAAIEVLYISAVIAGINLLYEPLQALFQGVERMRYQAYGDIVNKVVISALGIVLVLMGFGPVALVVVMLVAALTVLASSAWWARGLVDIDWRWRTSEVVAFLRGSLSYWGSAIFFTVYVWLDSAMLGVMVPGQVLGWYGLATRLLGSVLIFPVIISTAWLPRLSAAYVQDPAALRQAARRPLEIVLILTTPAALGAAIVAGPIIHFLYGSAFNSAVPVFRILVLTAIPTGLNIVLYAMLVASRRQLRFTWVMGFGTGLNLAANYLLIQWTQSRIGNGAIGASIALLLTETAISAAALLLLHDFFDRKTLGRFARSLPATIVSGALALLAAPAGVLAQVVGGAVGFAAAAYLLGVLDREDLEWLRRAAARATGRLHHASAGKPGQELALGPDPPAATTAGQQPSVGSQHEQRPAAR
jgi:lipopolysaccharide exporter